jgi:hypothetical protein
MNNQNLLNIPEAPDKDLKSSASQKHQGNIHPMIYIALVASSSLLTCLFMISLYYLNWLPFEIITINDLDNLHSLTEQKWNSSVEVIISHYNNLISILIFLIGISSFGNYYFTQQKTQHEVKDFLISNTAKNQDDLKEFAKTYFSSDYQYIQQIKNFIKDEVNKIDLPLSVEDIESDLSSIHTTIDGLSSTIESLRERLGNLEDQS